MDDNLSQLLNKKVQICDNYKEGIIFEKFKNYFLIKLENKTLLKCKRNEFIVLPIEPLKIINIKYEPNLNNRNAELIHYDFEKKKYLIKIDNRLILLKKNNILLNKNQNIILEDLKNTKWNNYCGIILDKDILNNKYIVKLSNKKILKIPFINCRL